MSKSVDNGEIVCGFLVRKDYEGQKDFDQNYKEINIKKRVKKIGEGDQDFIIEEYEEVTETPIREVIDKQVEQVGIEAYMKPYELAGVDLMQQSVDVSDDIQDFSQFPEDPGDVATVGDAMMQAFYSLDPALRGDAKTPQDFLNSLTDERLKAYFASKLNVEKEEKQDDK